MEVNAFRSFPALQRFISDENIEIKRVLLDTTSSDIYDPMSLETLSAKFYIFFEHKKDVLIREQRRLFKLIEAAKEVATCEEYYTLKNAKQRELYILNEFELTKSDAVDVIELLKPEMAMLFKEEEQ